MTYTEAFAALGYTLSNVRQSWSAANETGVCLALHKPNIGRENGLPYYDLADSRPDQDGLEGRFGHRQRTDHIATAMRDFDGVVDVVMVAAPSGKGAGAADPWRPDRRGGYWKITAFDPETGQFRADVVKGVVPAPSTQTES